MNKMLRLYYRYSTWLLYNYAQYQYIIYVTANIHKND